MTKLEPRKIDWTIPPKRLKYAREVYGFSKESVADFLGVTVEEIEEIIWRAIKFKMKKNRIYVYTKEEKNNEY